MKLCKDCRYFAVGDIFRGCRHPKNLVIDYSTGETKTKLSPRGQRSDGWLVARLFNWCGKEARWFEPREESA